MAAKRRLANHVVTACQSIGRGAPKPVIVDGLNQIIANEKYTVEQFIEALSSVCRNPQDTNTWLEQFKAAGLDVLNPAADSQETVLQGGSTTLQPTPVMDGRHIERRPAAQKAAVTTSKPQSQSLSLSSQVTSEVHAGYYDSKSGIKEIARTRVSQLLVGDRGTGKTTMVKLMLSALMNVNPALSCRIISTEPTTFLGLERTQGIVAFAMGEAEEMLPIATAKIQEVYQKMMARLRARAEALRTDQPPKRYEPFLLIIDSWSVIKSNLDNLYKDQKVKSGSLNTLSQLRAIIQQGSTVNIVAILVVESHDSKSIGLPLSVIRSMAIVGFCRVAGQEGGVCAFQDLISDRKLLSEEGRKDMKALFREGVRSGRSLVAPLCGTPRIFVYEDYSQLVDRRQVQYGGLLSEMA